MGEVFAWPEGELHIWTGTATAFYTPLYAENSRLTLGYGIDNFRTLDGVYRNQWTGQRADVYIGALYSVDMATLRAFADAQTGVNLHFLYENSVSQSAGHYLYSGAIDSLDYDGRAGELYRWSMTYHANSWSAY